MNSSAPWEDSTPLTLWLTDFWTRLSSLGEVDDFSITFVDFTLVPLNMAPQINPLATVSFKGSTSPALLSTHLRVMVNLRPKIYIYIYFYLKKKIPKGHHDKSVLMIWHLWECHHFYGILHCVNLAYIYAQPCFYWGTWLSHVVFNKFVVSLDHKKVTKNTFILKHHNSYTKNKIKSFQIQCDLTVWIIILSCLYSFACSDVQIK